MIEPEPYYEVKNGDPKPIRCPACRRIVGNVRRVNGVRVLCCQRHGWVYESTMGMKVTCPCGGVLEWHPGREAIDELIERTAESRRQTMEMVGADLDPRAG